MTLSPADGQIDYTQYTYEQLKQVFGRIDRERAPLNYASLVEQIKLRETALPVHTEVTSTPIWIYSGFFARLCARALDTALTLIPLFLVFIFAGTKIESHLWWQMPAWLGFLLLEVFLVAWYGGTPGKLILKLRITMIDGSSVTARASSLRMLPQFVTFAASLFAYAQLMLTVPNFDALANTATLNATLPRWFQLTNWLMAIWPVGECLSVLLNSKHRALHDFIAGTMVVERTTKTDIDSSKVASLVSDHHEVSKA